MLGDHLLGLYEKALDPQDDWRTRLTKTKAMGFDFMEISIDETDARLARLDWTREPAGRTAPGSAMKPGCRCNPCA